MVSVSIHEDDEGMRNLYPAAAFTEARRDIDAARDFGQQHQTPEGFWTDVRAIQEPSVTFADLQISLAKVVTAFQGNLPRIAEFEVGWDTNNPFYYKEIDALCFGFGPQLYVRLEADGDALQAIWFDIDTTQPKELAALRRAFESIDKVVPSLIADYWLNSSGLLEDRSFLDAYFDHFENPPSENHQIDLAHAPSENRGIWRVLTRILARFRL